MKKLLLTVAGMCALMLPLITKAQTAARPEAAQSLYVNVFGEYTDNINRLFENKTAGMIYGAGAGFDLRTTKRWLQARLLGDVSYLDSNRDIYNPGVLGNAIGRFDLIAIPERFTWTFEDIFGQIPVDERLTDTPTNRQNFNSFRTGPHLVIPFRTRDQLLLDGTYTTSDYEVALNDYTRGEGSVTLRHYLTPLQTVSLSGLSSRTNYRRDDSFVDFTETREFLEWSVKGARTDLLMQAGYNVYKYGADRLGSTLFNVKLSRKIGGNSTLIIQGEQRLSDTETAFSRRIDFAGVGSGSVNVSPSSGMFRVQSGGLHFITNTQRLNIDLSSVYERDRFDEGSVLTANDRNVVFSSFSAFNALTQNLVVGMFGDMTNADYVRQDFQYTEWGGGLSFGAKLSRSIGVQLSGAHRKRTGGVSTGGFEENSVRLSLYYAAGTVPLRMKDTPGKR